MTSVDADMKRIVILATIHQYQVAGHDRNAELERRSEYRKLKFGEQIMLEELSEELGRSVAQDFTARIGLHWANVGTPDQEQFRTCRGAYQFSRT